MSNIFNPQVQEIAGNVRTVAPVKDNSNLIKEQQQVQKAHQNAQTVQQLGDLAMTGMQMYQQHRTAKAVNEFTGGVGHADEIMPDTQGFHEDMPEVERIEMLNKIDNLNNLGAARKAGAISETEFRMKSGALLRQSKQRNPRSAQQIETAYNKLIHGSGSAAFRQKSAKQTAAETREQGIQKLMLSTNGDRALSTKMYDAQATQKGRDAIHQNSMRDGTITMNQTYTAVDQHASGGLTEISMMIHNIHKQGQGINEQQKQGVLNAAEQHIRGLETLKRDSIRAVKRANPGAVLDTDLIKGIDSRIAQVRSLTNAMLENKGTADMYTKMIQEVEAIEDMTIIYGSGVSTKLRDSTTGQLITDAIATGNQPMLTHLRNHPATAPILKLYEGQGKANLKAAGMYLHLEATNALFGKDTGGPDEVNPDGTVNAQTNALSPENAATLLANSYASPQSVHTFQGAVEAGGDTRERLVSVYRMNPEGISHLNKPEYQNLMLTQPGKYIPVFKDIQKASVDEVKGTVRDAPLDFDFRRGRMRVSGVPDTHKNRNLQAFNSQYELAKLNPALWAEGIDNAEDHIRHMYGAVTTPVVKEYIEGTSENVRAVLDKSANRTLRTQELVKAWEKDLKGDTDAVEQDSDTAAAEETQMVASERESTKLALEALVKPNNKDIAYRIWGINPTNDAARLRYHDNLKAVNALLEKLR